MKKLSLFLLPLLVAGCSNAVEIEDKADYKCGDQVISVEMLEDETAVLRMNSTNYVLNRVVTASGAKYEGMKSGISFWSKGDEAYLAVGDKSYPKCKEMVK